MLNNNTTINLQYSDINDLLLIEKATSLVNIINSDPRFRDPLTWRFDLKSDSPCINAGYPAYHNPNGTRADMGAYGGPEAVLRPLRILVPIDGNTQYMTETNTNLYNLNIQWMTSNLSPLEPIRVQISHWEDTGLVYDFDDVMNNIWSFNVTLELKQDFRNYFLTIHSENYPLINDSIQFKISKQMNPTLQMNR